MERYFLRRAEGKKDASKLRVFFNEIFKPEKVGVFAENLLLHFPKMKDRYWFIAEEKNSGEIAAACALLPWQWKMDNITLKVAEMGIVGTGESHRHQGLMRRLRSELMGVVKSEGYELVGIQGIPGFYDKLGFRYALPLCSHIDLPLHSVVSDVPEGFCIRPASMDDIPFLMEGEALFSSANFISAFRDGDDWAYLLSDGQVTEYGSDFLVFSNSDGDKGYLRISRQGFGSGLIVSEASETMSHSLARAALSHCRRLADEREKPYIRLDLHPEAPLSKIAIASGASSDETYAWQIYIPDILSLLNKMSPVLEKRISDGPFRAYSGKVKLDLFDESFDILWEKGHVTKICSGDNSESDVHFCVHRELFPALCLGHRSWRELRKNRPDIFPAMAHVGPRVNRVSDITGQFIDQLFPPKRSWIYEQY